MSEVPSERQVEILRALRGWIADTGEAPSVRELGARVGLSSTSSVVCQLARLEEQGLIHRGGRRWRSVRLGAPPDIGLRPSARTRWPRAVRSRSGAESAGFGPARRHHGAVSHSAPADPSSVRSAVACAARRTGHRFPRVCPCPGSLRVRSGRGQGAVGQPSFRAPGHRGGEQRRRMTMVTTRSRPYGDPGRSAPRTVDRTGRRGRFGLLGGRLGDSLGTHLGARPSQRGKTTVQSPDWLLVTAVTTPFSLLWREKGGSSRLSVAEENIGSTTRRGRRVQAAGGKREGGRG
ncbi:LexA family protein [Streptomyces sp. NPDC058155]|uniref:LexA family protein n=1 Tax=Streptomyces sp. NPDC058155 TaxID=3346359 RepID=UPI0036EB8E87